MPALAQHLHLAAIDAGEEFLRRLGNKSITPLSNAA